MSRIDRDVEDEMVKNIDEENIVLLFRCVISIDLQPPVISAWTHDSIFCH